jgi:hypothetical protein
VREMGEIRNEYKILVGIFVAGIPLGRLKCRWDDNTKINLQEIRIKLWIEFIWFKIRFTSRVL